MNKKISKNLIVSITGWKDRHWKDKLKEIEKFKLDSVALFLERFGLSQRKKIYKALESSCVKEIPFCHARHDMEKWEFTYLTKKFKTNCFNIHEDCFEILEKWKGMYKKLYLEMNYDNFIPHEVNVGKIGGFCIDLSHFMASCERGAKDFDYVMKNKKYKKLFVCNHLNGYDYKKKRDIHTVTRLEEFNYLKDLPKFIFGKIIAIEVFNSIEDQLKFKKYLEKFE